VEGKNRLDFTETPAAGIFPVWALISCYWALHDL
jgi:hypothetical protein